MGDIITEVGFNLSAVYNQLFSGLPAWIQQFVNITLLVILVTVYCIFVWKLYTFIARKDIIKLNLKQYNTAQRPGLTKVLGAIFYFIEYILILPLAVFLWFTIFTLFLIFLTEGLEVSTLLLISTVIVIVIRATAYYKEDLAKDIAKLFPLTLLAVSMTKSGFFNFETILSRFSELPLLFGSILNYLLIIILLEIILRFFDFIFSLFGLEELPKESEEQKNTEQQINN